ncbi:phosphoribosylglycinamide formyltransferase [Auritidibacter ignavus]|uniref:phosphoribosylglycinamide formyltransferase n=1 Tax=Auritidibacter ignavus TaxID=678932 RepID=UPI000D7330E8|nr:phosphoribosylglycinamide formyltransferase [Auritidibacter ignavus]PXA82506.1 phosphoribosylglycinamide formyltransferase [Auritidibacter sp. NML120779]WHS27280.1 phosphoribosylglycinamide formyltransferase [Auritidibacter ignavus]
MRVVVLLSGSGSNFQAVLDAVQAGRLAIEIVAVGSDTAEAYGLRRADAAELETFVVDWANYHNRTEWTKALLTVVDSYAPDLVVSSGLMRVVGEEFVRAYHGRFINTHPALLPSFPGAHAVRDALQAGVTTTGATVHLVDAGVDTGPIIAQTEVEVTADDDQDSLHKRIKVVERDMLIDTLAAVAAGHTALELAEQFAQKRRGRAGADAAEASKSTRVQTRLEL